MRQYAPPPERPKSIGISVSTAIAGISPELHAETRFRLTSVEIEDAAALDLAVFTPLWQNLIGQTISLIDIKEVLQGIENTYRRNDYRATAIVPPGTSLAAVPSPHSPDEAPILSAVAVVLG